MALIQCSECGHQLSDKAISCPMCGAPVASATLANNSCKLIKLVWEGKYAITQIPVEVKVNGELKGLILIMQVLLYIFLLQLM